MSEDIAIRILTEAANRTNLLLAFAGVKPHLRDKCCCMLVSNTLIQCSKNCNMGKIFTFFCITVLFFVINVSINLMNFTFSF